MSPLRPHAPAISATEKCCSRGAGGCTARAGCAVELKVFFGAIYYDSFRVVYASSAARSGGVNVAVNVVNLVNVGG